MADEPVNKRKSWAVTTEGTGMKARGVRFTNKQWAGLEYLASLDDRTYASDIVRYAVDDYLERNLISGLNGGQ